ncbi:hypothetical protein EPO15_15550 [bacterium]|nr:MAG: hypothetical protein EPO15_15550 [bacterium]
MKPAPMSPTGAMSAVSLAAVTGVVAWSMLTRPIDPRMVDVAVEASDFPSPAPAPNFPSASADSMRDAMASPQPIPIAGYSMTPQRPPTAPEAAVPKVPPGIEVKARANPVFAAMLAAPARFVLRKTTLGDAKAFKRFLASPKAVDAYLDSGLVRAALRSPAVTKTILANGGLVRAFLGSPAMQDPVALAALLKSPMFKKVVDCPGVQGALAEPSVMVRLVSDPATVDYLSEHPQAAQALAQAFPALAQAFTK